MRLIIARCTVFYEGRLAATLPEATRLIMLKADGCVCVHSDGGAYKPLNWMTAPNVITEFGPGTTSTQFGPGTTVTEFVAGTVPTELGPGTSFTEFGPGTSLTELAPGTDSRGSAGEWQVRNPKGETLRIVLHEIFSETAHDFGIDPGLQKEGVEADLQVLLSERTDALAAGMTLIRREYPTDIGPVDLLCRDANGQTVAVEIKRRGEIDGVEQLTRYLDFLNRDPALAPVRGMFVAQEIKPQAKTLANDRKIACLEVDYDELRDRPSNVLRLF